jgi:hypothetical protein
MSARSLVLWIGDHHGLMLEQPGTDVVGTVGMRLANAGRNTAALRKARRTLGLGVSLDTEPWRNQCRSDHVLRGFRFRALGYDVRNLFGDARLRIDRPLGPTRIADYARAHIDAQLAWDPTILQTPGHVFSTNTGLENDIALAEATLDIVGRRALREPADGDPHGRPRAVFASLCVRPQHLTDEGIRSLVARYVQLEVDGYWVWALGFTPSGRQTELLLRLVLALQENSGRPACPGGIGHLWEAALSRGAAAAIAGPDRASLSFNPDEAPPADPDRGDEDEDEEDGRRIHTYHGSILGSFAFNARGDAVRARTFKRNVCDCGAHARDVPPQGRRETTAHNQWWRLLEARRVCVGTAREASGALATRLPVVAQERRSVGIKAPLQVGWRRSVAEWDEAPIGWGAASGRAA